MRRLSGDLYAFLDRDADTASGLKTPPTSGSPSESYKNSSLIAIQEPSYLQIENVSFLYPNAQEPVLNHVNLTLKKGERVALVGPNGAGKSTLARLLLGLYRPQTGVIRVEEIPLNEEKSSGVVEAL